MILVEFIDRLVQVVVKFWTWDPPLGPIFM